MTMTEWIKCSDRLPEMDVKGESEQVLIMDKYGECYIASMSFTKSNDYIKKDFISWFEQSSVCGCCATDIYPTHWMPLPPPPVNNE